MPVLYLLEQGTVLHKKGEVFTITRKDEILQEIRAIEVEQIIVMGNIDLTTPVINYILSRGIDCVFCNSYGRYNGRMISTESSLGILRLNQAKTILNPARKLDIARSFVRGKLHNQCTLVKRYQRETGLAELAQTTGRIDEILGRLDGCMEVESLLGQEGFATAQYYSSLRHVLKQDLGFTARLKRPPPDPVNSLLSFGYTLLVSDIQSAVSIVGLDPFMGFLHSNEQSRSNLVLDLMEEFRPIIVDSLVLWLVNTRVMTEDDFTRPDTPGKMVVINPPALKKFIHHYEQRVQEDIFHFRAGGKTAYRRCFELQARELAQTVQDFNYSYKPFLVR
jgi:CRISP-associated protein Cas1